MVIKCCRKVERCDPSTLLSTTEMHLEHCPHVLGSPVQEQHENTGINLCLPSKGPQKPSRVLSYEERVRKQGLLSQEKRLSKDPPML